MQREARSFLALVVSLVVAAFLAVVMVQMHDKMSRPTRQVVLPTTKTP